MDNPIRNLKVVLVIGSAPDALRGRALPKSMFYSLVTINNAWRVREDWDVLVHAGDFPAERRPDLLNSKSKRVVTPDDYVPAQNKFGGFVFAGPTMAFTTAYWVLAEFRPDLLLFLGCDMSYDQTRGQTHFYGNGTADPLRDDKTLRNLEAKSARLFVHALRQRALCLNLSEMPSSRLVFPRFSERELGSLNPQTVLDWTERFARGVDIEAAAKADLMEQNLGYFVPDGRYWRHLDEFDEHELAKVDRLWLAAVGNLLAKHSDHDRSVSTLMW
ncbi:MAG: hypothetical protein AB7I34_09150 [Rhizobiaceae bacterium]